MRIIAGLGNPGEKYQNTRHNIGWQVLDAYLGAVKWSENKKWNALTYQDGDILFVKPLTFINNSGQSLQAILNYYKLLPKNFGLINKKDSDLNSVLSVVHDDLDLGFGSYKIATDSGSAGHNGIKSIIEHLKTQKFTRLRIGIKNELVKVHIPPDKFVLQPFTAAEKVQLPELLQKFDLKNLN
jgi:PTH1 family peptidyl-tRNA hydrolase